MQWQCEKDRIAIRLLTDATVYFVKNFILFPLFLPYMFRALISPSSRGISSCFFYIYNHLVHVVFMLLICMCLWAGLSWWFRLLQYVQKMHGMNNLKFVKKIIEFRLEYLAT